MSYHCSIPNPKTHRAVTAAAGAVTAAETAVTVAAVVMAAESVAAAADDAFVHQLYHDH